MNGTCVPPLWAAPSYRNSSFLSRFGVVFAMGDKLEDGRTRGNPGALAAGGPGQELGEDHWLAARTSTLTRFDSSHGAPFPNSSSSWPVPSGVNSKS